MLKSLVCRQSHDRMARLPAAGEETLAYTGRGEAPFVLFPNLGGLLLAFGQVRAHVGLAAEVVCTRERVYRSFSRRNVSGTAPSSSTRS